jgi:hypothetical protein
MDILAWAEVRQNRKQKRTEVWLIQFRNINAKVYGHNKYHHFGQNKRRQERAL